MKKFALILAALAASAAFSGCTDTSSPQSTLASAYTAIQKGQLKDLRETLTGAALATYGTPAGLQALQADLAGKQLKTGEEKYLGGEERSWRHKTYHYQVEVLVRETGATAYGHYKTAAITCEWMRGYSHHVPRDPTGAGDFDTPDTEECAITDLN